VCSLPASRRSGSALSKRDEFLKRDRQLSLRTPIPGSAPSLRSEFNPTTKVPQGPRRPRLSFFRCNCQTARSRGSTGHKPNSEATRRQSPIQARIPYYHAFTQSGNDRKFSAPASQQGGVRSENSRDPLTWPPQKRPSSLGEAHIGPCEISVNALSQRKFSAVETLSAVAPFYVHFHAIPRA
jgi:hypothetical protein